MNSYIKELAKLLALKVNRVVDLPFFSEEEEELFFELVIYKVLELTLGQLAGLLEKDPAE